MGEWLTMKDITDILLVLRQGYPSWAMAGWGPIRTYPSTYNYSSGNPQKFIPQSTAEVRTNVDSDRKLFVGGGVYFSDLPLNHFCWQAGLSWSYSSM